MSTRKFGSRKTIRKGKVTKFANQIEEEVALEEFEGEEEQTAVSHISALWVLLLFYQNSINYDQCANIMHQFTLNQKTLLLHDYLILNLFGNVRIWIHLGWANW